MDGRTPRFDRAMLLALELHRLQRRKGTSVPYAAHLLGVCATVLEHGGDEDAAIAALLHDAAEDQGGRPTLDRIATEFGPRVAALVEACTDSFENPKPPWHARKRSYLARLPGEDAAALLVAAADKLYNIRSLTAAHREVGGEVWTRFSRGREEHLWYFDAVVRAIRDRHTLPASLLAELEEALDALRRELDREHAPQGSG